MRGLSDCWCFCNGGSKSERVKSSIFNTKRVSMLKLYGGSIADDGFGTGLLIHKNLVLTTHANVPSVNSAQNVCVRLQNGAVSSLAPHRFFITSSVLDLTIVGLDTIGDSFSQGQPPHYSKLCSKPSLELGNTVYLLGHAQKKELTVGEGKVVIATDNLIKLSTEHSTWSPGSVGYDSQGNLAFMICDPMKLATLPNTKSSSTSSSSFGSYVKDLPMQFGIPMPIIFDWFNRHWEGSLDDLNQLKLPMMRLVSKTEHSCSSFTMRQIFKVTEEIEANTSSSNTVSKPRDQRRQSSEDEKVISQPPTTAHLQGMRSPEIYESPKVTAKQVENKETHQTQQTQLLNINLLPRISKAGDIRATRPSKDLLPSSGVNCVNEAPQKKVKHRREDINVGNEVSSTGSVDDAHIARSTCSSVEVSMLRDDLSSEGETLYSAETAESRNYTSPREANFRSIGRSQSCMSYNRWGPVHRNPVAWRSSTEKQRSPMKPRKTYSQGTPSHKTMDYISPTVSSIMKKRNSMNVERPTRVRPTAAHSSPKWNF